jgi:hypothetical protein
MRVIGASLRMMTTHADGPSSFAIQEESRSQGATDDEGGGWRSDQKASLGIGTLSDVKVTKFVQKDSPSTTTSDFLSG